MNVPRRYGLGDVLGCYIDLDNYLIKYTKNGKDLGVAFEIPKPLHGHAFYPAANVKNAELRCVIVLIPIRPLSACI